MPRKLWHIDLAEYQALCAYLDLTPREPLYDRLTAYLAATGLRCRPAKGFSLHLAKLRLTERRLVRLDLATKLFFPEHPVRYVLNAVIALHECDAQGYRELSASPSGWGLAPALLVWMVRFALQLLWIFPWLGWQFLRYLAQSGSRIEHELDGQTVLITGVNRGLGKDLMLHCIELGAQVIGTVRTSASLDRVKSWLPPQTPVKLLIADLSAPAALVDALLEARVEPASIRLAVLCAGVKHSGASAWSLATLRDTFQVNYFSAVEFAAWFCAPRERPDRGNGQAPAKTTLVLISSMGRWHGMHSSSGYNASKAALSIWGESLAMELHRRGDRRLTVTIVEPGVFESGMTGRSRLTSLLATTRSEVAAKVVSAGLAGRRVIRPPLWFALLTWGVCLGGRSARERLFAAVKPEPERE